MMSDASYGDARWVGKPVTRIDAVDKATGKFKFMSDLAFPGMLWGRVLRSKYSHALIGRVDTAKAEALPGVRAVLTARDVTGLNGFGIVVPDQPVLCWNKVRYLGDAVALVAADTSEIAEEALGLIEVEYQPLPVVDDPEKAMEPDSPLVHDGGNIHLHTRVKNGDVEEGFAQADVIIERTYYTPRQMHSFMETESGVGMCDDDGSITVWCGGQHPYRDQLQVARALGVSPEKIRIIATPSGGAFGGKDEITLQIYLALLARATRRPVKMVLSREESVVAGMKRHPMKITMKTGARADGTLVAHKVRIVADTGAYASLGGPVVNLAVEHSCGVYRIPNVELEGYCVYTNNGIAGAFRGFGANQVNFAMETQMNLIANVLGIDRVEIRKKNALRGGEQAPLGHTMAPVVGTHAVLSALEKCDLWVNREKYKACSSAPWKVRGVGVAVEYHGTGLGVGLPDYGAATIELGPGGRFTVGVSCPEIGQGNTTTYAQIAAEALGVDVTDIGIVSGDTGATLDSGSCTASRSVYTGGNSILRAAERMVALLREVGAEVLGVPVEEVAVGHGSVWVRTQGTRDCGCEGRCGRERGSDPGGISCGPASGRLSFAELYERAASWGRTLRTEGSFTWPTADKGIEGAFGLPHLINSYIAHAALVEVDTLTGKAEVLKVESFPDAGKVVNPQGLEGQSEGGAVMGIGYALMEDTIIEGGQFKTTNFSTYILPTSMDSPEVVTHIVEELEPTGPYGAKGIGEAVCVPITPAVTTAIHDACGVTVERIPATGERVYRALKGL